MLVRKPNISLTIATITICSFIHCMPLNCNCFLSEKRFVVYTHYCPSNPFLLFLFHGFFSNPYSVYILKYCCDELCHLICLLFHWVCWSGEFLLSLKVSRITPVIKHKGSSTDPKFCRPIAVLPTLAMVFEQTVHSQLNRHISPYIPPTQFGCIKGTEAQDCDAALAFTAI